jgi:5-methyltetrahydropteroyltriglutamate--homocysteine methyltransferase
MQSRPLRVTVIGSWPFPGWLEFASPHLDDFGIDDIAEMQEDAVTVALADQLGAGADVVTDGEQTRLDFNLSFYGFLDGIEPAEPPSRRFGPSAHDQRGRHRILGRLGAGRGLGVVEEFTRLQRLAPPDVPLKVSVPGPYTLSGRLIPNGEYPDRWSITEALLPLVSTELGRLVEAGATEICVDEPSMSCYAHREDPDRMVEVFNRTVAPVAGRCRIDAHLCFGNYKGHAVAPRRYAPLFPAFLDIAADEVHLEMAGREMAELEVIEKVGERHDVAVGLVDVKSYWVETPEEIAARVRRCLQYVPADRLALAPDCGLSQTARWAAKAKLANLVTGVTRVREELGL